MKASQWPKPKKVLMIAYAFPPMAYAGVFRTLRFCKYLPQSGWKPLILTLKEYRDLDNDHSLLKQLPEEVEIFRTPTVDPIRWLWRREKRARRNRASSKESGQRKVFKKKGGESENAGLLERVKGTILRLFSFPDHMIFWIPFAVIKGMWLMVRKKPDVIYTSSPPHSAQIIGLALAKVFKKPWIADFRDAWVDADDYFERCFESGKYMKAGSFLESLVVRNADKVLMVSDLYRDAAKVRYPSLNGNRFGTLTNGFDPQDVSGLRPIEQNKFTITYTGIFYAYRSPAFFLDGLNLWLSSSAEDNLSEKIQVFFVGSKNGDTERMIRSRGLTDIVQCLDFVPKKKAIEICLGSHLLLLVIGFNRGSEGILTSKLFDYFLCRKPILAIVPEGEAASVIRESKSGYVISEDNPRLVADSLASAYREFKNKGLVRLEPDLRIIEGYNGQRLTGDLAAIFGELVRGDLN
jgi:glycosyltransferase involved in cell wall biosynthesis